MNTFCSKIFLSPLFIFSLFLLLLNDFLLKQQFHNFLTGKLSDFAGLFVFPLFFAAFFPKRKLAIYISTAILFIFWKSPYSQSLIDFWNSIMFFKIGRIVDYTDLLALLVLPLSYFYFKTETQKQKTFFSNFAKRISACFIILLSVFAFTATQFVDDRNVTYKTDYQLAITQREIANELQSCGYIENLKAEPFSLDSEYFDNQTDFNLQFNLLRKFCDSQKIEVYMRVKEDDKNFLTVDYLSLRFVCKSEPTEQDKQELLSLFEREVIEKLRQNNPQ